MLTALGVALYLATAFIGVVLAFGIGVAAGRRRERWALDLQARLGAAVALGAALPGCPGETQWAAALGRGRDCPLALSEPGGRDG